MLNIFFPMILHRIAPTEATKISVKTKHVNRGCLHVVMVVAFIQRGSVVCLSAAI